MKAERKAAVIKALNTARSMELNAIHQYMNQHYGLDSKDYGELAASMKLIAIDEMRHAEAFAERVKELDGEPTADPSGPIVKAQPIDVVYTFDADAEDHTIDFYNQCIKVCTENGDIITAKLFETIVAEEQAHMTYFENIAQHLKTLGDVYLSKVAGTPSSTGPASKGFVMNQGA